MRLLLSSTGATPLTLAIDHRHWSTARLVLAIAVAQYKPADAKPPKFKLSKVTLGEQQSICVVILSKYLL